MRMTIAMLALTFALASAAQGDQYAYQLDRANASLNFALKQFGLRWPGSFADFDAVLEMDRNDPQAARLTVTVRTASLEAGAATGEMLRLFQPDRHPHMRFVSTRIERLANSSARVEGLLTVRGVTRPIVLDATLRDTDPLTFTASGFFRRRDFGITGWPWVSDRVDLMIEAPFVEPANFDDQRQSRPSLAAP